MKTSVSRSVHVALSSASLVAIALAGAAHADRTPAPIVYATPGAIAPSANKAASDSAKPVKLTDQRRVQFRYPGAALSGVEAGLSDDPEMRLSARELAGAAVYTPPQSVSSYAATPAPPETLQSVPVATLTFDGPAASTEGTASAPRQPIRIAALQTPPAARTGKPLTLSRVSAKQDAPITEERGAASIYADGFNGQPTANGEIFDETAMTAAHPSLPLPSLVQVINQSNGREVVVRVNDRGPFDGKRILELSPRAGSVLGLSSAGSSEVRVKYLGPAPIKPAGTNFAARDVVSEPLPPVLPSSQTIAADLPTRPVRGTQAAQPVSITNLSVSAPAVAGNVFIQAGAFADISNAQRLTTSLRAGLPVKIEQARVNGGDYFRVLIGPFLSLDAAAFERDTLARSGTVDGFLTTR